MPRGGTGARPSFASATEADESRLCAWRNKAQKSATVAEGEHTGGDDWDFVREAVPEDVAGS
jgi:hypothetical protein